MRRYVQLSHPGALGNYATVFFNLLIFWRPSPPSGGGGLPDGVNAHVSNHQFSEYVPAINTLGFKPTDGLNLCMDIPDPVKQELGGEDIVAHASIGEDLIFATPTRTLIFRSEGILSDERVEVFPHDIERLELSEGRRKTKFQIHYVDGMRSFSVPSAHARDVLTIFLGGVLRSDGVIDDGESVVGAFRFSELTVAIAEKHLLKHIGKSVWDDEFQTYNYEDITGLDFQEGNVATEIVVSIDGRPQRIKTPKKDARIVEQTLKEAVFNFYDVSSIEDLRRKVEPEEDEQDTPNTQPGDIDFSLDSDFDSLVSGSTKDRPDEIDADSGPVGAESGPDDISTASNSNRTSPEPDSGSATPDSNTDEIQANDPHSIGGETATGPDVATQSDLEPLREQISELSTAVQKQNKLLKKQHNAIERLVKELRK